MPTVATAAPFSRPIPSPAQSNSDDCVGTALSGLSCASVYVGTSYSELRRLAARKSLIANANVRSDLLAHAALVYVCPFEQRICVRGVELNSSIELSNRSLRLVIVEMNLAPSTECVRTGVKV